MEFLNIQSLLSKQINFSQFELKTLEKEEKELLILNLQSKVVSNQRFDRMLNKEHLSEILRILKSEEDSYIKTQIIEKIKDLDLVEIFATINEENLDNYQIIKKYYNDIQELLNIEVELTDKYIIIFIQYVLNGDYEVNDIKRIIKRTKEQYELSQEEFLADIESELLAALDLIEDTDEKQELIVEQEMNNLIHDLNVEKEINEETEEVLYITKLEKYDEIIILFRNALNIKYDMKNFLTRIARPFLSDNPRIISIDLIQTLLERVVKDTQITDSLKTFILQEIINFFNNTKSIVKYESDKRTGKFKFSSNLKR